MALVVDGVCVELGGRPVLHEVSLEVQPGEFVGLLGPNGAGKSTLLRTIFRVHRPRSGRVLLDGDDVHSMRPRAFAARLAVVLQEQVVELDYSAWEMVMLGRVPHQGGFKPDSPRDRQVVADALERVGAAHLASRSFRELSGGEKQRLLIARSLAQEAGYLLLDEPTNHLDVRYQLEVCDLLRGLGLTVLAHDLNLAAGYCDRLYLLDGGRVCRFGTPEDVIDPGVLRAHFGVEAAVERHPTTGRPYVMFDYSPQADGERRQPFERSLSP